MLHVLEQYVCFTYISFMYFLSNKYFHGKSKISTFVSIKYLYAVMYYMSKPVFQHTSGEDIYLHCK